jgi:hypothetical protein
MWSAFQCATYAELSKDQKEQERLFLIGVKAGRDFLEALKNGRYRERLRATKSPLASSDCWQAQVRTSLSEEFLKMRRGMRMTRS